MQTVNYIPDSMKRLNQWVLWKLIDNRKIPFSGNYQGKASPTNNKTWCSYDKAVQALKAGDYNGLGFVFSQHDNLIFIDLDHCFTETGELTGLAQNVISHFPKSYIELSQSKQGVHIVCKGTVLQAVKTAEIEIYSCGRYMACTGLSIQPQEPQEQQEQIDRLYSWLVNKRDKAKTSTVDKTNKSNIPPRHATSPTTSSLSIDEIIQRATSSKGGREFQALYNGDWKSLHIGDNSQSASDQSFANRLCFWCGGDTGLMYEIFRASGMYRTDRKAWLAINNACKTCGAVFRPKEKR